VIAKDHDLSNPFSWDDCPEDAVLVLSKCATNAEKEFHNDRVMEKKRKD